MEKLVEILNQQTGNFFKENNIDVKEIDFLSKDFYNEKGGFSETSMIRIAYIISEKIKYFNIYDGIGMRTNTKDLFFSITDEKIDFIDFPIYVYGSIENEESILSELIISMKEEYQDDDEYINNMVYIFNQEKYLNYSFKIDKNNVTLEDVENLKLAYENVLNMFKNKA